MQRLIHNLSAKERQNASFAERKATLISRAMLTMKGR